MKIYNYHPITKEFLSESTADESPLEPGVFLIPACATEIQPPVAASNEVAVFENGSWQLKADFRNKKFWKKATKESVEITEIGVIPDETLTDLEPAKFEKWGENGWEFNQEAARAEYNEIIKQKHIAFLKKPRLIGRFVVNLDNIDTLLDFYANYEGAKLSGKTVVELRDGLNNRYEDVTIPEFESFFTEFDNIKRASFIKKWDAQDAVNAAQSIEEMEAILNQLDFEV